jgi:conjugal transfer/entry exclusion protein
LGQKVKNQLEERIALLPSFIDNQKDYLARLAAVDATLANYEEAALTLTSNEPVGSENRKRAQKDLQNIREVRSTLIKNRASTREEVMALPPGSWFLYLPTGRIEQRK